MEVKIKTKDFLVDATIEMVDGVMLVSPVADVDLKPKKWKPGVGELFYFPRWDGRSHTFYVSSFRYSSKESLEKDTDDWMFQTEEECEKFCKKLYEKIKEVEP